jgi:hypothetical protein
MIKMKYNKNCDHKYYAVSPELHDVEGCFGTICEKCGRLSCMCESKLSMDEAFKEVNG